MDSAPRELRWWSDVEELFSLEHGAGRSHHTRLRRRWPHVDAWGKEWRGPCPAHGGDTLAARVDSTRRALVVRCNRGCSCEAIAAALGVRYYWLEVEEHPWAQAREVTSNMLETFAQGEGVPRMFVRVCEAMRDWFELGEDEGKRHAWRLRWARLVSSRALKRARGEL